MAEDATVAGLERDLAAKMYQESACLADLKEHTERDAAIRKFIKTLSDHLRHVENAYRANDLDRPAVWKGRRDHGIITHQDDMSKVDLPHFIEKASSDITRWRYDVNAHVNIVTEEAIVFSHEQGGGPKNAASIAEMILLDHITRCRGESLKVVVSDNASVCKNWLTTVALPQYIVDQGLADITLMIFLENNHGKFFADMLFGQMQTRKKKSTILSIDGLLAEFESINRRGGRVRGFAVNPLSCVDFSAVFKSLGYEVTPPKDVCFTKRNVHFAAACAPGALDRLPITLRTLLEPLLPTDPGMVRLCSQPPSGVGNDCLPFEKRHIDVPAASPDAMLSHSQTMRPCIFQPRTRNMADPPLVVSKNQRYASSGHGVVSVRNMEHVGYNGIEFRKLAACAELHDTRSPVVREAWPPGLLTPSHTHRLQSQGIPDVSGIENIRCAPENWVVRKPVSHFRSVRGEIVARYPPRNMRNAKFKRPPRSSCASDEQEWIPVATYKEPPFPVSNKECAYESLQDLASRHNSSDLRGLRESINVLDILRAVCERMGNRGTETDRWMQNGVTIPAQDAVDDYLRRVAVFKKREAGHPKAPISVYTAFRNDPTVMTEVEMIMAARSDGDRTQLTRELFGIVEMDPRRIRKYEILSERDHQRYAAELKHFREVTQREFDERHHILPVTTPPQGSQSF